MRKLILIAFFAIATTLTYAQGIEFFYGTFAEAKAKATKENKKIFVDVFTTWCGPCKKMAKEVFPDKAVGEYFNKNFVSMKLDAENEASHDFFKSFKATSYPSFFWVDENGVLLDKQTGLSTPDGFITMAKKALVSNIGEGRANLKARWDGGERNHSIIKEYVFGILPETNPEAIVPTMIEYVSGLSEESRNSMEIYELIKGMCQPRDGFLEDNIITQTYFANMKKAQKYDNKYSTENQSFTNTLYRTFVRMHTAAYLNKKEDVKVADGKVDKAVKYIKGLNFPYTDFCLDCIEAERLIYTGKYEKGISKMSAIIAKYGEEFPTVRDNFMYTLIIGNYFLQDKKPVMDEVLKMATDNLKIAPSQTAIAYYATANYAAGNYKEAYSAFANMHFYDGKTVSNAVYSKMNIMELRKAFPASTPETDTEKARFRNLMKEGK